MKSVLLICLNHAGNPNPVRIKPSLPQPCWATQQYKNKWKNFPLLISTRDDFSVVKRNYQRMRELLKLPGNSNMQGSLSIPCDNVDTASVCLNQLFYQFRQASTHGQVEGVPTITSIKQKIINFLYPKSRLKNYAQLARYKKNKHRKITIFIYQKNEKVTQINDEVKGET